MILLSHYLEELYMYESGENYLETILILGKKNGSVRSIDIARELNFSKPSVSRAVGILKDNGFIAIEDNGSIKLTVLGEEKAANVFERHQILTAFLVKTAGVSQKTAEEDACKIEHIISDDTFQGIKKYLINN
jgi:Mn-dependent DtxR family transcriptional regulator